MAEFIVSADAKTMSKQDRKMANRAILDCVGVTLAGSQQKIGKIMREYVREQEAAPQAAVIGTGIRSSLPIASFANGTMGHALDYDDVSWPMIGHPTVAILPTLLAFGERRKATGADVITAYIIGLEISAKLGALVNPPHYERGWHATGTLGTMGAVAGASRLIGLNVEQTRWALGIAASQAAGIRQNFGTDTKPFHAGHAAQSGVAAALLAEKGFTSDEEILDSEWGFFTAFCGQQTYDTLPAMLDNLGNPWEIEASGILLKNYASCVSTHTAIDAMLSIIHEHDIKADDVIKVDVAVVSLTPKMLIHHRPTKALQGKFSMEYCMARALLSRDLGITQFADEKVSERAAQELLRKVTMYIDDQLTTNWRHGTPRPAEVAVTMRDGRKFTKRVLKPKGNPEVPLTEEELITKFRTCAGLALSEEKVQRSLAILQNLDQDIAVASLMTEIT
jgi:2-methylcitrate dehydratase PrpD